MKAIACLTNECGLREDQVISEGIGNRSLRLPRTLKVGRLSVETVKRAHALLERGLGQEKLVRSC